MNAPRQRSEMEVLLDIESGKYDRYDPFCDPQEEERVKQEAADALSFYFNQDEQES